MHALMSCSQVSRVRGGIDAAYLGRAPLRVSEGGERERGELFRPPFMRRQGHSLRCGTPVGPPFFFQRHQLLSSRSLYSSLDDRDYAGKREGLSPHGPDSKSYIGSERQHGVCFEVFGLVG